MKQKLIIAMILGAVGTSAYATCQFTPQGCPATPSTSSSTSSATSGSSSSVGLGLGVGGSSSATAKGGKASVSNSGNSTVSNAGNSNQRQAQHQAQTANGGNSTANGGNGGTGGNSSGQSINFEGQQRTAASAFAPPLTSSNDTCMGSSTGALQVPGVGVSIGSTWTDKNCVMLKNSRELWNMGMKGAAMARMCMDADNREALELSGVQCPTRKQTAGPSMTQGITSNSGEYVGNDNIVRARLGMPLVKETR